MDRKWIAVFLTACFVRGALFCYVAGNPTVFYQPDSRMYRELARGIQEKGTLCYPGSECIPNTERMPGYPAFLASVFALTAGSILVVIVIQAILDSISCVLVGILGERVWGVGLLSGLMAAVNLNMVTYSHFVLNDSLFLFFLLTGILAIHRFMKEPDLKWAGVSGAILGLAIMVRPVLFYVPLFLLPFIWVFLKVSKKISLPLTIWKIMVFGVLIAAMVGPWLMRNHLVGGRFQLTSQAGEHLYQYVVPMVWQYSRGIPFIEGMKRANRELAQKNKNQGVDWNQLGQFERSDRQVKMAVQILKQEPISSIVKAWIFGMAKNLFSPAVIDFSYLLGIERPHFFYTQGKTLLDRGLNFIRGIHGWFGWAVVGSLILMPIFRLGQLWGLVCLFRREPWVCGFFVLIIGYFLLVSGPVGYAKYRLPFEPVLIVLLAIGFKETASRFSIKRLHRS